MAWYVMYRDFFSLYICVHLRLNFVSDFFSPISFLFQIRTISVKIPNHEDLRGCSLDVHHLLSGPTSELRLEKRHYINSCYDSSGTNQF